MTKQHALYEVWFSTGNGLHLGPRFRLGNDAERYVQQHLGEASFAVRAPDGHWTILAANRTERQPPR